MKQTITATEEGTLLELLCRAVAGVPRKVLLSQIKRREVKVGGVRVSCDCAVHRGDTVELFLPQEFAPPHVEILYRDENIVAVDKPDLVESQTQLPALLFAEYGVQAIPAHRLDTRTTGVLLLCFSNEAKQALVRGFADGQVKKTYIARVFGTPPPDGVYSAYLTKDAKAGYCRVSDSFSRGSVRIQTALRLLCREGEVSLLELCPITGKTHQLRAHLRHLGCFIVGDDKYGDEERNKKAGEHGQNLRAVSLTFGHLPSPLHVLDGKTIETAKKFFDLN